MSARTNQLDRYDLYELCVQSPERDAALVEAIHGNGPSTLGEDFCGTAALSRYWAEHDASRHAVAVDHDAEPLARAAGEGVSVVRSDVLEVDDAADAIFVGNFSIGEIQDRPALIRYLEHALGRLTPGGVLLCDIYGGSDAHARGEFEDELEGPAGERVRYVWEQREADPITARVVDALHFEVDPEHGDPYEVRNAFIYHWRLWTVAELREAMLDAGFAEVEVYDRVDHAMDDAGELHVRPLGPDDQVEESFIVFVVGRVADGGL